MNIGLQSKNNLTSFSEVISRFGFIEFFAGMLRVLFRFFFFLGGVEECNYATLMRPKKVKMRLQLQMG